jgi:MSHA biogenesis protein MshN
VAASAENASQTELENAPSQFSPAKRKSSESGAPASRLSFELSPSTPLPGSHPNQPVAQTKPVTVTKGNISEQVATGTPSAINAESAVVASGSLSKQIKPVTVQQQAEIEFRKANQLTQLGRNSEALSGYEAALRLDASHDAARLALVGALIEGNHNVDAESVLQEGLKVNPKNSGFAMLLARLQVERGAASVALQTLKNSLPFALRQADYQAFIAAVEQRLGHHKEAVEHYQIALQSSPDSGIWLMGLGISLKTLQRNEEAQAAFKHALDSKSLNADLQTYVTQQLKELP